MKTIASLEIDMARVLVERLKQESISAETRAVAQEGGLEYGDILVADDDYDRACDIAEAWDTEQITAAERRANQQCPTCGSTNLDYIDADIFGATFWKCNDCGNSFAK
jgi:DNA-directed RNA polymerase subunit M/transcription elongation factor TFIIS